MTMQAGSAGRIGPNAILQLVPVLDAQLGTDGTRLLLQQAGIIALPDGHEMIPEDDAARLHCAIRQFAPENASRILQEAGHRTADYILAHRIPRLMRIVLKGLPAPVAAYFLARAIARHAWTFVGSGKFRMVTPWRFEIMHNPLIAGEAADRPLCMWHAAVFERLYRNLVRSDAQCMEVACGAQGHRVCAFVLQ